MSVDSTNVREKPLKKCVLQQVATILAHTKTLFLGAVPTFAVESNKSELPIPPQDL